MQHPNTSLSYTTMSPWTHKTSYLRSLSPHVEWTSLSFWIAYRVTFFSTTIAIYTIIPSIIWYDIGKHSIYISTFTSCVWLRKIRPRLNVSSTTIQAFNRRQQYPLYRAAPPQSIFGHWNGRFQRSICYHFSLLGSSYTDLLHFTHFIKSEALEMRLRSFSVLRLLRSFVFTFAYPFGCADPTDWYLILFVWNAEMPGYIGA